MDTNTGVARRGSVGPQRDHLLSPAEVRAELPFQAQKVGSGAGWPAGLVAERFRGLPPFSLERPGETHHRLIMLLGSSSPRKPAHLSWRVGDGQSSRQEQTLAARQSNPLLTLVPAGCDHSWLMEEGRLDTFHLLIPPSAVDETMGRPVALAPAPKFQDPAVAGILQQIAGELASPGRYGGPLLVESLSNALSVLLGRREDGHEQTRRTRVAGLSDRQVAEVRAYLLENLRRNIRTKELAGLVHLSSQHFTRAFGAATGMPPHQFQLRLRVRAAAKLLKQDQDLGIEAAARQCGFTDRTHLSRAMKRHLGVRPSQAQALDVPSEAK